MRNLKAEHEAEIMAADERAARRWADQAERMRQMHEEEKLKVAEAERERARERIQKELNQIESDAAITRERSVIFKTSFLVKFLFLNNCCFYFCFLFHLYFFMKKVPLNSTFSKFFDIFFGSDQNRSLVHFTYNVIYVLHTFRLNQERIIEKERQQQHIEYLKESNQNQLGALIGIELYYIIRRYKPVTSHRLYSIGVQHVFWCL